MSYQERRALVSLISSVLITVVYFAYMSQRYPDAGDYSPEVFRFWGGAILLLIPVSIVARIIIYILFSIINTIATHEDEPSFADEHDKLVELKSLQISLYVFSLGFVAAMVAVVLKNPPSVMFMILIGGGLASDMVSEFLQFYFYRRGV